MKSLSVLLAIIYLSTSNIGIVNFTDDRISETYFLKNHISQPLPVSEVNPEPMPTPAPENLSAPEQDKSSDIPPQKQDGSPEASAKPKPADNQSKPGKNPNSSPKPNNNLTPKPGKNPSTSSKPKIEGVSVTPKPNRNSGPATPKPNKDIGPATPKPGKDYNPTNSKPNKDSVSVTPKPGKDNNPTNPKPNKDGVSVTPKPGKDNGSSNPKPDKESVSATPKPGKDNNPTNPKPDKESVSATPKPNKDNVPATPKPNKDSVSATPKPNKGPNETSNPKGNNNIEKTTIINRDVPITKVNQSNRFQGIEASADNNEYAMALRKTADSKILLSVTDTGTDYTDIGLEEILKKKCKTDTKDIAFNDITCIENIFYITGAYRSGEKRYQFCLSTKDGLDFNFSQLPSTEAEDTFTGYLYKAGNTFLYTAEIGTDLYKGKDGKAEFFISGDLKKWSSVKLPDDKSQDSSSQWKLAAMTDSRMLISACHKDGSAYQLLYTADFKTFQTIDISGNYMGERVRLLPDRSILRVEQSLNETGNPAGFKLLNSTDTGEWNTIFKYDPTKYKTPLISYYWDTWDDNIIIMTERVNDCRLYVYSINNKTMTEYSTKIRASLVGNAWYDDGYWYAIYDMQYLLITNSGYQTINKIMLPPEAQNIAVLHDNLIIMGVNNYYLQLKQLNETITQTGK